MYVNLYRVKKRVMLNPVHAIKANLNEVGITV